MKSTFLRVGIIGASGYTGVELVRLLQSHPQVKVTLATASGDRAGTALSELFPSLHGLTNLICEPYDIKRISAECDFVFVALPHGTAMKYVPEMLDAGIKVCDLGADFRLRDKKTYEKWYQVKHSAADYLKKAVYGLPEWNRKKIRKSTLVANPGCYPTAAVLPLSPLLKENLIDDKGIVVDAASGTSGAGRSSFSLKFHYSEVVGDFKAYSVGAHRHTPEIEQGLGDATEKSTFPPIIFTPHVLPVARGILCTNYATAPGEVTNDELYDLLKSYYKNEPFVRVLRASNLPQIKRVSGSNFCDVAALYDKHSGRVICFGAIDNLVKGASGQAVQNMNLMCGFEEKLGIAQAPLFP